MAVNNTQLSNNSKSTSNYIKYLVFMVLEIPSVILYVAILIYFIRHCSVIKMLHNVGVFTLFVISFIQASCDLPIVIHFYRLGYVSPSTAGFCLWWTFFDFTLNTISELLMATISIQRHIFVFHSNMLRVRKKRLLFHDLPIIFSVAYPILLYIGLILIYRCDRDYWDFSTLWCAGNACYAMESKFWSAYDWIVNNGVPVFVILLANITLILRVLCQKRRIHQPISWQKQRRMTLQLFYISSLYFISWLPNVIIGVIKRISKIFAMIEFQSNYLYDFIYLVCVFVPYIILTMIPELKNWIRRIIFRRQFAQINTIVSQ